MDIDVVATGIDVNWSVNDGDAQLPRNFLKEGCEQTIAVCLYEQTRLLLVVAHRDIGNVIALIIQNGFRMPDGKFSIEVQKSEGF